MGRRFFLLAVLAGLALFGGGTGCSRPHAVRPDRAEPASKEGPARFGSATAGPGTRRALLVGVTRYDQQKKCPALQGPANDVVLMRKLLVERFQFPEQNVVTLSEEAGGSENRPTRANIEREFRRLARDAGSEDTVVILLAGHGSQQPEPDPPPDPDNAEVDGLDEVFLPADTGDWDEKTKTIRNAIVDDEIGVWLKNITATQASVWFIVDACHSGNIRRSDTVVVRDVPAEELVPRAELDRARERARRRPDRNRGQSTKRGLVELPGDGDRLAAIYACRSEETEPELMLPEDSPDRKHHGLLTFTLNQVLMEAAAPLTYVDSACGISAFWPAPDLADKNRLQENQTIKTPRGTVGDATLGLEHMVVIAVEAQEEPVNFSCLEQTSVARAQTEPTAPSLKTPLGQLLQASLFGEGRTRGLRSAQVEEVALRVLSWETLPPAPGAPHRNNRGAVQGQGGPSACQCSHGDQCSHRDTLNVMTQTRKGLMKRTLLLLALLLTPLASLPAADAPKTARPNILLIVADDMGFSDASCYGGEIATPNLDALAKAGLRFSQFYNTARCWPSRAAILTGYYAQQVRRDTVPGVKSGAQGTRPAWARLLPEMLKPLGYRSYHSGKWHVDGKPLQNGFDRSYSLDDHDRHFAPRRHTEDDKPLPVVDARSGYYSSTAIADHAIKCLKEHAEKFPRQPFLEYLAFTAPHFPLQAPAEDIAPYRKKYLAGWDALRNERWRRMKEMKIGGTALAPVERDLGPPYAFPEAIKKLGPNELNRPLPWKDLNAEQREFQAAKMAIHAAMVDRMDREIGRVLAQLRAQGTLGNTLVFFLSDNGASAEIMVRGDGHDPHAECGTGATFLSIGPGWSSLANTPFRRHKTWVHEGGISTPLIVHWPKGIAARGEVRHTPGHVIDLVPTILEVAGGKRLAKGKGQPVPPPPGKSLTPLFAKDGTVAHDSLWWLHEGNRALRVGDWKIVAAGKDSPWELYDLSSERSESRNLARDKPAKVSELAAIWTKQLEEYTAQASTDLPPEPKSSPNK